VTFDPLLAIMHPRDIPDAVAAFRALDVRRAWLQGYTEWQLAEVVRSLVDDPDIPFTHLVMVADDVVVQQPALDAVLALAREGRPVVTGWCRLDSSHPLVNITDGPLVGNEPTPGAYRFRKFADVVAHPSPVIETGFVGFALTCMPRDLWRQFPFGAFGGPSQSWASDFHLSHRLRDAGVPMVAAREGYTEHLKERWLELDRDPRKRLLVGERPAQVIQD
jgi:GT2 family glycosyltransferase